MKKDYPLSGLTQGAQPIMSYNYGAKNKERMKDTFKYLCISTVTYSTVFWLFIMIAPQLFSKIFTNDKAIALLRKVFLLIPLVLILPNILSNKVFAVFLAEPISDISSTLRSMPNTPSYNYLNMNFQ